MTTISNSTIDVSERLMELRQKIRDDDYVNYAVQRIAQVLSRRLVEENERVYVRGKNESK
ncbi:MAG: hypothetical protein J6J11_05810 [Treponema sp.]|nr:hypothetical protein [Treponema sp.]MBQ7881297.1 hypothetical protein [Treponema sp.]